MSLLSSARGYFGFEREIINPSELNNRQKTNLAYELTPITAIGFMREISDEKSFRAMFQDVYNHVVGCQKLTVHRDTDYKSVAFTASGTKKLGNLNVYHLEGIVLSPEIQGNGFAHEILIQELHETGADVLAFHTQSGCMEKLGLRVANYDTNLAREAALLIGTENFVDLPEGPIDKGRYGGSSLYGDVEAFDPIAIKRDGFDFRRGDAIVFAGFVKE
jgi:hypothetical protein